MNDDGPGFCYIDDNDEPTNGATMLWTEIIDVKKMLDLKSGETDSKI